MLTKFGLILLVVIFGALMFVAGAIAPDAWRLPLAELAKKSAGTVSAKSAPKAANTANATEAKAPAADAKPAAIPYDSLLLPSPLPPDGVYALQLGPHTDAAGAEASAKNAKELGYPVQSIAVVDRNQANWIVVGVGKYSSPEDARAAYGLIAQRLKLKPGTRPVVIVLPPAPKSG